MKKQLIALTLLLGLSLSAVAEEKGFKPLFNGKDFTGWAGPIDNYQVTDGTIQCKPGKGGTIYTKDSYDDFVVRLEIKLPEGGNNGLAIRYPGKGDTAYVGMCELQVLDNTAKKYAKLHPAQYHGSAYGMAAAKRGTADASVSKMLCLHIPALLPQPFAEMEVSAAAGLRWTLAS